MLLKSRNYEMKKLLSLPPGLVKDFLYAANANKKEYFASCDPIGKKLGSGGGTINLLLDAYHSTSQEKPFEEWLASEHRILIHAGGQSRRLPAYAPLGKILAPIPVMRWARGQRIDQTLFSLQLPLFERIMEMAGKDQHTLICSGDALVTTPCPIPTYNKSADVICFAIGAPADIAKNHGVFLCNRKNAKSLDFMLQKPSPLKLAELSTTHFFLIDVGIWILSDRAIFKLKKKFEAKGQYDLYSEFGCALGNNPSEPDSLLSDLSVDIVSLDKGEFFHFGTTNDMITSAVRLQETVKDGRDILHFGQKPHGNIFTQNSLINYKFNIDNQYIWVENSYVGNDVTFTHHNFLTGFPAQDIKIDLTPGLCLDIVPIGEKSWAVRPYGFNDPMRGACNNPETKFIGKSVKSWMEERDLTADSTDIQSAEIFGIADDISELQNVIDWMILGKGTKPKSLISADNISNCANIIRLTDQRKSLLTECIKVIYKNRARSVFYQLDLSHIAEIFKEQPKSITIEQEPTTSDIARQLSSAMLIDEMGVTTNKGNAYDILRNNLISDTLASVQNPTLDIATDQIVWARCPVRIDLAGGWTDTPPHCLLSGGDVVNMAIELNHQQPLQVYIKPCKEHKIILRSIDMGVSEIIQTRKELLTYNKVENAFSIPKAALVIAGFGRKELREELLAFGSGIEITLLSAIPAGSGLGTSSILSSTVLAALSNFAALCWDKNEICRKTLVLEQMLTTGGGWQDQYGGVLHGIKRLTTQSSLDQTPEVRWLPTDIFTDTDKKHLHLLYYTGVRRTAKHILDEIVRGMFLQRSETMYILGQIRENSNVMFDALQRGNINAYAESLQRTWYLNKRIDSGTNPPIIEELISRVNDLTLGYKLPGAGGGGFLYMLAKDEEAAARIKSILTSKPITSTARFVDMTISNNGLMVSRS